MTDVSLATSRENASPYFACRSVETFRLARPLMKLLRAFRLLEEFRPWPSGLSFQSNPAAIEKAPRTACFQWPANSSFRPRDQAHSYGSLCPSRECLVAEPWLERRPMTMQDESSPRQPHDSRPLRV